MALFKITSQKTYQCRILQKPNSSKMWAEFLSHIVTRILTFYCLNKLFKWSQKFCKFSAFSLEFQKFFLITREFSFHKRSEQFCKKNIFSFLKKSEKFSLSATLTAQTIPKMVLINVGNLAFAGQSLRLCRLIDWKHRSSNVHERIQMSHWHHTMVDGNTFWISYHGLAFLSIPSHRQLI